MSGRKAGFFGYGEEREIYVKKVVYRLVKMSRFQGVAIVLGLFEGRGADGEAGDHSCSHAPTTCRSHSAQQERAVNHDWLLLKVRPESSLSTTASMLNQK